MIHVTRELLLDWRKQWMQDHPVEEGRDHVTPFDALLYSTHPQPIPAIPTDEPGCYRIQIEDGAWMGTLDEWRALLELSRTRRSHERGYTLLTSEYADMMEAQVSGALREGWECQGGHQVHYMDDGSSRWSQAMVRE